MGREASLARLQALYAPALSSDLENLTFAIDSAKDNLARHIIDLNAQIEQTRPKETEESLLQSVESYEKVAAILGEERVFPLMFFLGIQPNTDLEQRLLEEGYPLSRL